MSFFLPSEPKKQFIRSARTPAASPNVFLPKTVYGTPKEARLIEQGLDPNARMALQKQLEDRQRAAEFTGEEERETRGLMGGVENVMGFIQPAVEGTSAIDLGLGIVGVEGDPAKKYKERLTADDNWAKDIGVEVIDGILSPWTLLEVGAVVFSGGGLTPLALASFASRTAAKQGIKTGVKRASGKGIRELADKNTRKNLDEIFKRTDMDDADKLDALVQVTMKQKIPRKTYQALMKTAKVVTSHGAPRSVTDRGRLATANYILARNGMIDAGAVGLMKTAESADAPQELIIGAGLLGGLLGAGVVAPAVARSIPETKGIPGAFPKVEKPELDIAKTINETIGLETYPAGVPVQSSRVRKRKGRADQLETYSVTTPAPLTLRTIDDLGAEQSIQLTRTLGTPEQVLSGRGKVEPYEGTASFYQEQMKTGQKRSDRIGSVSPYAKAFVDIRINPKMMKSDWDVLPEVGFREADKDLLLQDASPGKNFFQGRTDEEKFAEYVEYRKLQELLKDDPQLFGVGNLDINSVDDIRRSTMSAWDFFTDRGKTYVTTDGNYYLETLKGLINSGRKRADKIGLEDVLGKKTWWGDFESVVSRSWDQVGTIARQNVEKIYTAKSTLGSKFDIMSVPIDPRNGNSAVQWIAGLRQSGKNISSGRYRIEVPLYDFLRNPEKFRSVLSNNASGSLSINEFQTLADAAGMMSVATRNIGNLIQQAGGGINKLYDAGHTSKWDETINLNFIPEVIDELPTDIINPSRIGEPIQVGNDGSRFIAYDKNRPEELPPGTKVLGDIWPLKTGRIYYNEEIPFVKSVDEVVDEVPYQSTEYIVSLGARVQDPFESAVTYIEDGTKAFWQRHVSNEALTLTDADSVLADAVTQLLNYGPRSSRWSSPTDFIHLTPTAGDAEARLQFAQKMREMIQPKTKHDANKFTRWFRKFNALGITLNTVVDVGAGFTLGATVFGKNPKVWFKAVGEGIAEVFRSAKESKDNYDAFLQRPDVKARQMDGARLYESTPDALAKDIGGTLPKLFYERGYFGGSRPAIMRFQQSFTQTLNELRVRGSTAEIKLKEKRRGTSLSSEERFQIQQGWNKVTAAPVQAPGQIRRDPLLDMSLDDFQFAAGFFRSQRQVIYDSLLKGGTEATVARSALTQTIAAATMFTLTANLLLNEQTGIAPKNIQSRIDPLDSITPLDLKALSKGEIRMNTNFLTISTGNQEIDLGFGIKPLMNLFLSSTINSMLNVGIKDTESGKDQVLDTVGLVFQGISTGTDMKGAPVTRLLNDAMFRRGFDFHGNPIHPFVVDVDPDDPVEVTSLGDWRTIVTGHLMRFAPIWGATGLNTAVEEIEWTDKAWHDLTPVDYTNIGMTTALQMSLEFMGMKARVSSPKDKLNTLALLHPESYGSLIPRKWDELTPAEKRDFEETYPVEVEKFKDFESQKQFPTRKVTGWLAIEERIADGKQEMAEALGYGTVEEDQSIHLANGEIVHNRSGNSRDKVVLDLRNIRARMYREVDKLRTEYGLNLNPGSNGSRLQNHIRNAYDQATQISGAIDFELLDIHMAQIENQIDTGFYNTDPNDPNETLRMWSVYEDVAPPNTDIIFVDQMIESQRILSNVGWYAAYDEGAKKFGSQFAQIGMAGEAVQNYTSLKKELELVESSLQNIQINAMNNIGTIPNKSVIEDHEKRISDLNKIIRQVDDYVNKKRDAMVARGNMYKVVATVEKRSVIDGRKIKEQYTGLDVIEAMIYLGKRKKPAYVDSSQVKFG